MSLLASQSIHGRPARRRCPPVTGEDRCARSPERLADATAGRHAVEVRLARFALRRAVSALLFVAVVLPLLTTTASTPTPATAGSLSQPSAESAVSGAVPATRFAPSLEGRWRLVEQRYETGQANLTASENPLHLEFTIQGGGLAGRIWSGDDPDGAQPWPAFLSDSGPLSVEVVERSNDAGPGTVAVRYRVRPAPGDDLVLEIEERYSSDPDGNTLSGTVRVTFSGGEMNRGGYVLHRRFEREP